MHTVLAVDDDPALREIFTIFLERAGYTVLVASGGEDCIALLKTTGPDLILLDLMMEPMDGWDTLHAIRNNPATEDIPVMIITGKYPTPADILKYGGMIEDFIVKPIDFRQIAASLHKIIENDKDLKRVVAEKRSGGDDPTTIAIYIQALRRVRILHRLIFRFRDTQWVDSLLVQKQEEELNRFHHELGFPDRFLEGKKKG